MIFSLACQTACDGWRNVDYVTEAAKFFSYWTFMPWIIVTYTGLSVIDGILGTEMNLSRQNVMHLGRMLKCQPPRNSVGDFSLYFDNL